MTSNLATRNNFWTVKTTPALVGRTVLDDIFDTFFNDPAPMIKKSTDGYPITDIYKDEKGNQIIEMALAGFEKEDIVIKCGPNKSLIISCDSNLKTDCERYQRRIAKRKFQKTFIDYHSQLNFGKIEASFKNGLLTVKIPQVDEEVFPKIKIL